MEVISGTTYYTLNEILLREYVIALKKQLSNTKSDAWQIVFLLAGIKPPYMDKESLDILTSTEELEAPNTEIEFGLHELSSAEKRLSESIANYFSSSDENSLINAQVFTDDFPSPLGKGFPNSFILLHNLKPDQNLSEIDQERHGTLYTEITDIFRADRQSDNYDTFYESFLSFMEAFKKDHEIGKDELELLIGSKLSTEKIQLVWLSCAVFEAIANIQNDLFSIFKQRLTSGEIYAIGYEVPLKATSLRKDITKDHWNFLEFNTKGEAEKNEYKYIDLLFKETGYLSDSTTVPVMPAKLGRSTKMGPIIEEMKRRAKNGELNTKSLKAECVYLREWCQKNHQQVYKIETLQKNLAELYRKLVSQIMCLAILHKISILHDFLNS